MLWITLTVFLGIIFWGGIATYVYGKKLNSEEETFDRYGEKVKTPPFKSWSLISAVSAATIWALATLAMSVHVVGERQVAIVYNFSGTIAGKKDKGVATTMPWQHVTKENIGIQHDEWKFLEENSAVSKDQQKIFGVLSVNYQIDNEKVVDLYRRVGQSWKTIIIDARVPQVFKEVTSTYQTPEITSNREKLRLDTKQRLIEELAPYDIKVVDVFVKNLGFSKVYTDAIEEKQKQVQDAQRAEAKVKQVEAEARQKVAEAEGRAKSNIALARGEATANKLRQSSLTPLLVQQQAIEKLNPNVNVIVCPPRTVCIPNANVVPVETK
jgi:regulator of protease activity HflC (stomatin/prohibitin superfamily)